MLAYTAIELPEPDLMIVGSIRFNASQLVSGLTATSLAAPAIVFRSRMMLRPLVSVPPIAGNLASTRAVSPTCTARSESWSVLAARASVPGPGRRHQLGDGLVLGVEFVSETG